MQIPKKPSQDILKILYILQQTRKTQFVSVAKILGCNWNPCFCNNLISAGIFPVGMDVRYELVLSVSIAHSCKLVGLTEDFTADVSLFIWDSGLGVQPEEKRANIAAAKSTVTRIIFYCIPFTNASTTCGSASVETSPIWSVWFSAVDFIISTSHAGAHQVC